MRAANISAAVTALLWLGLAMIGRESLRKSLADRVPDYPSLTTIDFSFVLPMLLVTALLTCAWFCNAFGRWPLALACASVTCLAAILPWLMISGGGV